LWHGIETSRDGSQQEEDQGADDADMEGMRTREILAPPGVQLAAKYIKEIQTNRFFLL